MDPSPTGAKRVSSVATTGLVLVCAGVFLATCVLAWVRGGAASLVALLFLPDDASVFVDVGALSPTHIWLDGQWWRLLTAAFVHGSLAHLVLNLMALRSLSQVSEPVLGAPAQLGAFGVCAISSSLASLVWNVSGVSMGASGAIFGLAGLVLAVRVFARGSLAVGVESISPRALGAWLAGLLIVGGILRATGWVPIDQAGHIGGLACGLVLGALLATRGARSNAWRWALLLAWTASLALLALRAVYPAHTAARDESVGHALLSRDRPAQALQHFDRAFRKRASHGASAELRNALAYAMALAGERLTEARELAAGVVGEEPHNADYLDTFGWVHCRAGDAATGMALLQRARLATTSSSPEIAAHIRDCKLARELAPEIPVRAGL
ncbi:MAG: rhomboid family intramembrane serine protease [Nannocystaceae bacterium]